MNRSSNGTGSQSKGMKKLIVPQPIMAARKGHLDIRTNNTSNWLQQNAASTFMDPPDKGLHGGVESASQGD